MADKEGKEESAGSASKSAKPPTKRPEWRCPFCGCMMQLKSTNPDIWQCGGCGFRSRNGEV